MLKQSKFGKKIYLSMNGLPFRGDIENTDFTSEDFGGGIYLNTLKDLLFEVEPKLLVIAEKLPSNSKYTSADIQNQVIEALQNILKAKIADDVNKARTFTVMMDGSSDKSFREIEGIVVRCINEHGKIEEHAIDVVEAEDRSTQVLVDILVSSLTKLGISLDGIVSQCYDGASVMSGGKRRSSKITYHKT